jgi:hypothetical protein
MDANDRSVDHLDLALMSLDDGIHQPVPDPGFAPALEAVVDRRHRPIALRQVAPACPERRTQKMPFNTRRSSTRGTPRTLVGKCGSIARHSFSVRSYRPISNSFKELESRFPRFENSRNL